MFHEGCCSMNMVDYPDGATPLSPDEMEGLRFSHVSTRSELDQLEQANIVEGMNWLKKQKNPDVVTERFLCELHKRLFGKVWVWGGVFRTTEKNLGVAPTHVAVKVRLLLEDVRYWIDNRTYPPKELAARFHHRLVLIHPFPNGNGRHARIMADALLTKVMGEPPIDWAGGHRLETMNKRREHYISALRAADNHDYRELLKFVGV